MASKCALLCWRTSGGAAAEVEVKHKLSEDQCSGLIFSDVTAVSSAQSAADRRQLSVVQQQRQSEMYAEVGKNLSC